MTTKQKVKLEAILAKDEDGRWILELSSEDSESSAAINAMLQEFSSSTRDHAPSIILVPISSLQGLEHCHLRYHVSEGPDIAGSEDELLQLKYWTLQK